MDYVVQAGGNCADTLHVVSEDEARRELERLLTDARFHLSGRNREFLRYIVDHAFNGGGKGAKAYAIAVDIFGRPGNFDPVLDPIVRIEGARVRSALDQYYELCGAPDNVRIILPRGRYVAEFSHVDEDQRDDVDPAPSGSGDSADAQEGEAAASNETAVLTREPGHAPVTSFGRIAVAAGALMLASCVGVLGAIAFTSETGSDVTWTGKPLVTVLMTSRTRNNDARADELRNDLLAALARFGTLRLADREAAIFNRSLAAAMDGPALVAGANSLYQISLTYDSNDLQHSVFWTLTEPATGETLTSGKEIALAASDREAADRKIVSDLARLFGSSFGLVSGFELHRHLASDRQGNTCVLRSEHAIRQDVGASLNEARRCLEATLRTNDQDADANATLAKVLVAMDQLSGTAANAAAALVHADRAISVAPHSDRALVARMVSLQALGRTEAALALGEEALAANPLNPDVAATFALRLYLSGQRERGLVLAQIARENALSTAPDAALVIALEAYRAGEYQAALKQLDSTIGRDILGPALRSATLSRLGRQRDAGAALYEAEQGSPSYRQSLSTLTATRGFDASLADMLMRDIADVSNRAITSASPGGN